MFTRLPDPTSPIAAFCAELIRRLDEYTPLGPVTDEEAAEKQVLTPVVNSMKKLDTMKIYPHPWNDRDLTEAWREIKKTNCAEVYGTRHTADMYISVEGTRGISIDVKVVNVDSNKMPNGALQTLIGQCVLASTRHDFAIGLFAHHGHLHQKKWNRDTEEVDRILARMGVYIVRKYLGPALVGEEARTADVEPRAGLG